jgi:hypothetical protein
MAHKKQAFKWHGLPQAVRDREQLRGNLNKFGFDSIYTHVRAFHACCPVDVWEYFLRGLRPPSRQTVVSKARALFLGKGNPTVTEDHLREALEEVLYSRTDGRVYVGIDDRELVESCGHYLMFGSEAVAGVAADLTRCLGWNVQTLLAELGTPTVVVVDVPCSRISATTLEELSNVILSELEEEAVPEGSVIDFTIVVEHGLPKSSVVSCYSVLRIADAELCHDYVCDPKLQGWRG